MKVRGVTLLPESDPVYPQEYKHSNWQRARSETITDCLRERVPQSASKLQLDQPYDRTVVAYIITFKPKPGKLDIRKCKELGVPAGPLLGVLKNGENVVLDDGTTVKV